MFVRVNVEVSADATGNTVAIPGVLTPAGLLTPLVDYLQEKALSRSPSWMDKVVRSVRLFCYYLNANPANRDTRAVFDNFATALQSGTIDLRTGEDPSGLYWRPKSGADRSGIVTDLTLFFDWMGKKNPTAANINPKVAANVYEQRWNSAARLYRRENSLLGHLWSNTEGDKKSRRLSTQREPVATALESPAFPEDKFQDFITDGWGVGSRVDHRGICITLLLHGAGFRASEPFHLYVQDVVPDPTNPRSALVTIHHPSAGYAPENWRDPTVGGRGRRDAYLAANYGLKPRHLLQSKLKAGWKGGLYDADNYKQAHWFEPWHGELFLYHWNRYIEQLVRVKRNHPFLFVNLRRGTPGAMYQLGTFNDAHAAACRRIGLLPLKSLGTTPHGHRHAYGQKARKAKLDVKIIQLMLHHASENSQKIYTGPSTAEVTSILAEAHKKMGEDMPLRLAHRFSYT
ncbi:gamma-mobile-trio recombinase GmtY [Roseateles sp.]|uniref:gamma-mobile-trio recombinase GmtY n=1 Tax=Roseateles sp. TaxID=1971397 RepID=UPI003BA4C811